jgi:transcriptional regulator with XRE-family HTH domain
MQTIGERLEEARKKKGISIREAAEATKIRGDYLQKFEGNQFDIGLTELYARGFLRNYASFLKLPTDRIIADYAALGHGEVRPRQPSREIYGRLDISVASAAEASDRTAPPEEAATEPAAVRGIAQPRYPRGSTTLPTGPDPALVFKYLKWGGLVVVALIAVASMVVGAFGAINQSNIKRLMAYSSIGHVGYALVGLAVADADGIRGMLVYLAIYLVMNLGTFACILGMRRGGRNVESISDLAGLARTHPLFAAALGVLMFSMAGIPPLAGFFGKLYVFLAAVEAKMFVLAAVGLLTSVIAAFYYIRIVRVAYFDEPDEALDRTLRPEVAWIA